LLASYRAFFAQNLCRSSSFFSVTATTFRYTQESSDSHAASFLSLEMAMGLVGSVSDAPGNILRCNASLSVSSLSSLPLSLLSLSLALARLVGLRAAARLFRASAARPRVRPSSASPSGQSARPSARPSVRLPEPTHKSTFWVHTTNSSHLPCS
jgi:hypothetical protein